MKMQRKPKTDRHHWSEAEKQLMTDLYAAKVPAKDIAERLKRRLDSVYKKALEWGLKERIPHKPKKPWTKADIALLRRLYPHRPTLEITEQLDRGIDGVYRMAFKLGLQIGRA